MCNFLSSSTGVPFPIILKGLTDSLCNRAFSKTFKQKMIRTRITAEYIYVLLVLNNFECIVIVRTWHCIVTVRICEYSSDPIFNCHIRQRDFMSLIGSSRILENKIIKDPATTEGSLYWKIPKFCEILKINSNLLFVTEDMRNQHLKLLWMAWKRQYFCIVKVLSEIIRQKSSSHKRCHQCKQIYFQSYLHRLSFIDNKHTKNIGRVQWNKLLKIIWRKLSLIDELFNAKTDAWALVKIFISLVWLYFFK